MSELGLRELGEFKITTTPTATERRYTKGLMSRTIAVHVRYKSLYIALLSSFQQQRELSKFCVFGREQMEAAANFSYFPLE